jgi:hypothetical protein
MPYEYTHADVRELRDHATREGDYQLAVLCTSLLKDRDLTDYERSTLGDMPWGDNMTPQNIERTIRGALILRAQGR